MFDVNYTIHSLKKFNLKKYHEELTKYVNKELKQHNDRCYYSLSFVYTKMIKDALDKVFILKNDKSGTFKKSAQYQEDFEEFVIRTIPLAETTTNNKKEIEICSAKRINEKDYQDLLCFHKLLDNDIRQVNQAVQETTIIR